MNPRNKKIKWPKPDPKKDPSNTCLIIDADTILYQEIDNCLEEYQSPEDEWTYKLDGTKCKLCIHQRIDEYKQELIADHCILAFTPKDNFRKNILPTYKHNRSKRKPLGFWGTIEELRPHYSVHMINGIEADDVCGIFMTDPNFRNGMRKIMVSEDKDAHTIPGDHYNPRLPDEGVVHVTPLEAEICHLSQTMIGDVADGYKGCPGVGKVSAKEILTKARMDGIPLWDAVVEQFKKKELTEADALQQARVAYIMQYGDYNLETGEVFYWNPKKGKTNAAKNKSKKTTRKSKKARRPKKRTTARS